jgi:hypothetical protein
MRARCSSSRFSSRSRPTRLLSSSRFLPMPCMRSCRHTHRCAPPQSQDTCCDCLIKPQAAQAARLHLSPCTGWRAGPRTDKANGSTQNGLKPHLLPLSELLLRHPVLVLRPDDIVRIGRLVQAAAAAAAGPARAVAVAARAAGRMRGCCRRSSRWPAPAIAGIANGEACPLTHSTMHPGCLRSATQIRLALMTAVTSWLTLYGFTHQLLCKPRAGTAPALLLWCRAEGGRSIGIGCACP